MSSAGINLNEHTKQKDDSSAATAALFVSLYVVILAFFILLTSKARFDEEKMRDAVESVNKAFSKEQIISADPVIKSVGQQLSVTQYFHEIAEAVATVVPVDETKVITEGSLMRIELPTHALFNKNDTQLRPERAGLFRRIGKVLNKWRDGAQTDISFIQGVAKPSGAGATAASNIEVARGGGFAREMENRGAPPEAISIAIRQGVPDKIFLEFFVRSISNEIPEDKKDEAEPVQDDAPPQMIKLKQ